jgi:hypothetical protein
MDTHWYSGRDAASRRRAADPRWSSTTAWNSQATRGAQLELRAQPATPPTDAHHWPRAAGRQAPTSFPGGGAIGVTWPEAWHRTSRRRERDRSTGCGWSICRAADTTPTSELGSTGLRPPRTPPPISVRDFRLLSRVLLGTNALSMGAHPPVVVWHRRARERLTSGPTVSARDSHIWATRRQLLHGPEAGSVGPREQFCSSFYFPLFSSLFIHNSNLNLNLVMKFTLD